VQVTQPSEVTDELHALWEHAHKRLVNHRGGLELYLTIRRDVDDDELLAHVVASGAVWTIGDDQALLGFALVRDEVVECLFVDHQRRRERVATELLNALVAGENPPKDGYALPGDRGMKSLYESFGWKARLLTMRGE
jgi:GNAT superfamily N-acetyltransferase